MKKKCKKIHPKPVDEKITLGLRFNLLMKCPYPTCTPIMDTYITISSQNYRGLESFLLQYSIE